MKTMRTEYLKIRDDVDLKELEKFEFRKYRKNYIKDCKSQYCEDIRIEVDGRETAKIDGTYGYIYGIYYYSNNEVLDTLFDLISAGLVEKVVEDESK